ncbi:MAG: two-component, sigma-54 specific, transcriptional regulator, Fis family [Proteobacteria bacterium]|nr:two-component, sigma-54 specific, transcriptional regulator, Fis family [Pseudomonadota bacterium]
MAEPAQITFVEGTAAPDAAFGPWPQHSVLVVDDEEGMRSFLSRALGSRCGLVEAAPSAEAAAELVNRIHFDVVILDIALPGKSGVEWLRELKAGGFAGDVILITAFADIDTAIQALRAGAADYILKPFRLDQILAAVKRSLDRSRLVRENFVLKRQLAERSGDEGIVGQSEAIQKVRAMVRRLAPLPSTVLLQGESGTGKEVVARALHELSPRASRPFVPVNCGAISPELIESELFGHAKGAFTGAADARNGLFYYAQGGTIFLDEIAELPQAIQTKLLRVVEDRRIRPVGSNREVPVDVRIIAATNRDLGRAVAEGRFREDLFYRLDVVAVTLPPLRERPGDIAMLARHFVLQLAPHLGVEALPLTADVARALAEYPWPGNARELRNFIERSLILGHYPLEALAIADAASDLDGDAAGSPDSLAEVEKRHMLTVLEASGGNKTEAARRLGISRKTLERKCALWGIRS